MLSRNKLDNGPARGGSVWSCFDQGHSFVLQPSRGKFKFQILRETRDQGIRVDDDGGDQNDRTACCDLPSLLKRKKPTPKH